MSSFAPGFVTAAKREFESWEAAVQAAGFPPPHRAMKWTPERILSTLRRHAAAGVAPRMARFVGCGIYEAAKRSFGSWEQAAQAAGLKPAPRAWKWSRERILSEVRKFANRGVPLTKEGGLYASLRHAFGGVKAAKKAAGVLER
jgi:hypothetical protein